LYRPAYANAHRPAYANASYRGHTLTYSVVQDKPDHGRCVAIVAASALREMVAPGALAVLMPIAVGVTFRIEGAYTGQEQLGAKVVAGFIMFATVTGVLMALFLNTAGGAWDNAN